MASGQTINAMTLGGLALSIGVLVDDFIVVLENISKKMDSGMASTEAAIAGANEVAMPVLSSTLSTLIVLFPVIFLSGIVKVLFSAVAKSVMFAMIGAYLTSITVMPLFAAHLLKQGVSKSRLMSFLRVTQKFMQKLTESYGAVLIKALRKRKFVLTFTIIFLVASLFFVRFIGTELFPRADAGNFTLEMRLSSGTRIEQTEIFAREIEGKLRTWIPK